jgi:hypothetical protein
MEKETQELLAAAKALAKKPLVMMSTLDVHRLANAVRAFEAAQAKHPEHVMFLKADDGARTR